MNLFFFFFFLFVYLDACSSDSPPRDQEMKEKGAADVQTDSAGDEKPPRKEPSEDSKFRWIAFVIFAVFNVVFGITMIVLIAL